MVGRCSDYLHLVLFERATEKQHDVTDILIGAWFTPGSLPDAVLWSSPMTKWGRLQMDFHDHTEGWKSRAKDTANQDIKLIAWRRQIGPVLLFVICRTFLHYSKCEKLVSELLTKRPKHQADLWLSLLQYSLRNAPIND